LKHGEINFKININQRIFILLIKKIEKKYLISALEKMFDLPPFASHAPPFASHAPPFASHSRPSRLLPQMAARPTPTFTGYLPCVNEYDASAERRYALNQAAFRQQLSASYVMAATPPQLVTAQQFGSARPQRSHQLPARFRT
jgi:hypothetical protein